MATPEPGASHSTLGAERRHADRRRTVPLVAGACGVALYSIWTILRPDALGEAVGGTGDTPDMLLLRRVVGVLVLVTACVLASVVTARRTVVRQLRASNAKLVAETESHLLDLEHLRHADRLSTLGRLASSVAHELGTPLNVIEGRAIMIASGEVAPENVRGSARIIAEQSARMTQILREILNFARRSPLQKTDIHLSEVVRKAMSLASQLSRQRGQVEFGTSGAAGHVVGDPEKILQVLMNLIMNGVQAMQKGGVLSVLLSNASRRHREDPEGAAQAFARIDVADEGMGIPGNVLPKLFAPFFTTKEASEGTGLGLSISQGIVRDHGGWIDVESTVGHGSCFTVYIPRGGTPHVE